MHQSSVTRMFFSLFTFTVFSFCFKFYMNMNMNSSFDKFAVLFVGVGLRELEEEGQEGSGTRQSRAVPNRWWHCCEDGG